MLWYGTAYNHSAVCYGQIRYATARYSEMYYGTTQHGTARYSACDVLRYNTVRSDTA